MFSLAQVRRRVYYLREGPAWTPWRFRHRIVRAADALSTKGDVHETLEVFR